VQFRERYNLLLIEEGIAEAFATLSVTFAGYNTTFDTYHIGIPPPGKLGIDFPLGGGGIEAKILL
jgi:hypothetical protein